MRGHASKKRMVAIWRVYGMNMGSVQRVLNPVTENHSAVATAIAPLTTAVAALRTNIGSVRLVGAVVRRGATAMYVVVAKRSLSRLRQPDRNHSSRSHVDDRVLHAQDRFDSW